MTLYTDDFSTNTIGTDWEVYDGTDPVVSGGLLQPGNLSEFRMVNNDWAPEEDQFVVALYKLSTTLSMDNRVCCKGMVINGGANAGGSEGYVLARSIASSTAGNNALHLEVRRPSGTTESLGSYVGADMARTSNHWYAVGVQMDGDDAYAHWWHVGDDTAKGSFDPYATPPDKTIGPVTLTGANQKLFGFKKRGKVVVRLNADSTSHRWDLIQVQDADGYTPNPVVYTDTAPFGEGAWPDATWRPNEADHYFGQAIAKQARPLPESDEIVGSLIGMGLSGFTFLETRVATAGTEDDWDIPLYWASEADPEYELQSDNRYGTFAFNGTVIRLPADAKQAAYVSSSADRHLSVVQPDGVVWNLYDVSAITPGAPGTIDFGWGGYCPSVDGEVYTFDQPNEANQSGSVAISINAHTGQIRAVEMEAGEIRHPLMLTIPCSGGEIHPSPNPAFQCPNDWNLLYNGGAESADITGYEGTPSVARSSDFAHSGSYSFKAVVANGDGWAAVQTPSWDGAGGDFAAVQPGDEVTGSVWVRATDSPGRVGAVWLFWHGADGSHMPDTGIGGTITEYPADEWTYLEVTGTAPEGAAFVRVYVDVWSYEIYLPDGEAFYADDFSISVARTPPKCGQWLRLNMTDAEIDALAAPDWKKIIWKAMANYGMFVGDTKGGNPGSIIRAESSQMYVSFGYDDPWEEYCASILGEEGVRIGGDGYYYLDFDTGMDWTKLQALDPFSSPVVLKARVNGAWVEGTYRRKENGLWVPASVAAR